VSVRVQPDNWAYLVAAAERRGRSVSSMVNLIITSYAQGNPLSPAVRTNDAISAS
jgi:hypothetical protein